MNNYEFFKAFFSSLLLNLSDDEIEAKAIEAATIVDKKQQAKNK